MVPDSQGEFKYMAKGLAACRYLRRR